RLPASEALNVPMRTIIAGSRRLADPALVEFAMDQAAADGIIPTVVLCGEARGVDRLGRRWAEARGIPVESFPANWRRYRRGAGGRRNQEMAEKAEALVAIWDGVSKGTADMIRRARERGLKLAEFRIDQSGAQSPLLPSRNSPTDDSA